MGENAAGLLWGSQGGGDGGRKTSVVLGSGMQSFEGAAKGAAAKCKIRAPFALRRRTLVRVRRARNQAIHRWR